MKTVKKILNLVVDILIILVLVISAFIAIMSLTQNDTGVPNLFGYAPMSVQTDSMVPEFEPGDLIIAKVADDSTEYEVGDIVSFPIIVERQKLIDTHRIIDVVTESGQTFYVTKGDNKEGTDSDYQTDVSILAKYTGTKFAGVGNVLDFLRTQWGFFFAVVLPMIILFVYEAIRVIRNMMAYSNEKAMLQAQAAVKSILASQGNTEIPEEELKRAVQNYMIEQNPKKAKKLFADEEINASNEQKE